MTIVEAHATLKHWQWPVTTNHWSGNMSRDTSWPITFHLNDQSHIPCCRWTETDRNRCSDGLRQIINWCSIQHYCHHVPRVLDNTIIQIISLLCKYYYIIRLLNTTNKYKAHLKQLEGGLQRMTQGLTPLSKYWSYCFYHKM